MAGTASPSSGRPRPQASLQALAVGLFLAAIAAGCSAGSSTGPFLTPGQGGSSHGAAQAVRTHRSAGKAGTHYVATIQGDTPLAFYRLNEQSGSTAYDSSGNGNNGGYSGTVDMGQPALLKGDISATSVSFPVGQVSESATWSNPAVSAECWMNRRPLISRATPHHRKRLDRSRRQRFMVWISSGTSRSTRAGST